MPFLTDVRLFVLGGGEEKMSEEDQNLRVSIRGETVLSQKLN